MSKKFLNSIELDGGNTDLSGLKFTQLNSSSANSTGGHLGVDSSGNVIKLATPSGLGPTLINGNSGVANSAVAPCETWQILTANSATIPNTTPVDIMTMTELPAGTYLFEYYILWQSSATTNGITFSVDFTGTVTRARSTRHLQTTGTTAASGVADGSSATLTGQLVEHYSSRTDNGALGPNTGVDTINVDQFDHVRGIYVVSTSGSLILKANSEAAVNVQVMADTMLILKRLA